MADAPERHRSWNSRDDSDGRKTDGNHAGRKAERRAPGHRSAVPLAQAANYPCSGSKGGVAHCAGTRFVCNDGSISGSKRICSAGDGAAPAIRPLISNSNTTHQADKACSCRANRYCTGPRGGRYCLSDSGKKSYLRD